MELESKPIASRRRHCATDSDNGNQRTRRVGPERFLGGIAPTGLLRLDLRHALAPGNNDPPGFRLDDCATQRNLSAEGRAQAVRVGELFRANGIPAADILLQPGGAAALETATLMRLGEIRQQPLLNSFVQDRSREARQIETLRQWIGQLGLATPTVFVTHQVVITASARSFPAAVRSW